jgi:hypothetical protein
LQRDDAAHALLGQVGCHLAARHRDLDELVGHAVDVVVLAVEEREPARLRLLDDRDLEPTGCSAILSP